MSWCKVKFVSIPVENQILTRSAFYAVCCDDCFWNSFQTKVRVLSKLMLITEMKGYLAIRSSGVKHWFGSRYGFDPDSIRSAVPEWESVSGSRQVKTVPAPKKGMKSEISCLIWRAWTNILRRDSAKYLVPDPDSVNKDPKHRSKVSNGSWGFYEPWWWCQAFSCCGWRQLAADSTTEHAEPRPCANNYKKCTRTVSLKKTDLAINHLFGPDYWKRKIISEERDFENQNKNDFHSNLIILLLWAEQLIGKV